MAKPYRAKRSTTTPASSSCRRPPQQLISDWPAAIPVTEAEIQLVMTMLGPRLAKVFTDEPDN